jgi:hypothetical protein
MATLQIENDGQAIIASNFWDTAYAQHGAVFLSVNAAAFRLLQPDLRPWRGRTLT